MIFDGQNIHEMCEELCKVFTELSLSKDLEIEKWRLRAFDEIDNNIFETQEMRMYLCDEVLSWSSQDILDHGFLNFVHKRIEHYKAVEKIKKRRCKKKVPNENKPA